MSKTLKKTTDSESKATNMRWTNDIDRFLLNVMLEEQNNGNSPNETWSSHAYSNMSKKYSESFGYAVEKESYSPMVSPSYSCETPSKKAKKTPQMVEMLEKQIENFQFRIDNVAASIRQGNEIAKEGLAIMMQGHEIVKGGLAIMERGCPPCYSEDEVFPELVKIGIPMEHQLDAMLFLIKDPTKMRAFFCVPTTELC
nr:hypothetical protein CFP56_76253 [Quercus suber]